MSNDDEAVPLEACTLPGTIEVTGAALEFAKQFQASIPAGWIVVFSWLDGRKTRASNDTPWIDLGPGLGVGAYRNNQIPQEAIYHDGAFRYAVLISTEIVEDHPERLIDLDGPRSVVLK